MLKGWSRSAQLLSAARERTDRTTNVLPRSGFVLGREADLTTPSLLNQNPPGRSPQRPVTSRLC
jgi:hypothetical protein